MTPMTNGGALGGREVQEGSDDIELDGRVAQLIAHAALAGAYGAMIRQMPETARGFGRLHTKHSARVAALADEIAEGAHRIGAAPEA